MAQLIAHHDHYFLIRADSADDLRALARMDMKWIAIQERLPGENISVLLYDKNKEMTYVGYRLDDRWWYGDHYGRWDARVVKGDITHWMPLPDSPQIIDIGLK